MRAPATLFTVILIAQSGLSPLFAQNRAEPTNQPTEGLPTSKLGLVGGIETVSGEFELIEADKTLRYSTSALSKYNLTVDYNKFSVTIGLSSYSEDLSENHVHTQGTALMFQGASGSWGWVGHFYNVRGFNLAEINEKPVPQESVARPDMSAISVGANVYYVFFPESFSPGAAFRYLAAQTYSGWSPILQISYDTFSISANGSLIPEYASPEFPDAKAYSGSMSSSLSMYGGIGGLISITQRFYAASAILIGAGPVLTRGSSSEGELTTTGTADKFSFRLSFGYKDGVNACGFHSYYESIKVRHQGFISDFAKQSAELYYGRRTDWDPF